MDASTAVSSRLIGAIFVEKGLVTSEQLERAMQIQAETGARIGEIIVAEFGVARLELASVLAEQWAEFERSDQPQDAPAAPATSPASDGAPVEPLLRRPIGEIFVDRGFVTDDQLQKAVEVQSKTGQRIGEVLVEQGSLTRLDLASALAEQWSSLQKLRPPEPVTPEPWHGGALVVPAPTETSPELRSELTDLEGRVRVVERAAAASPWEADLGRLSAELRAALEALEERLGHAEGGTASSEGLDAAVADLRQRVDAPAARLEELEQRVAGAVTTDEFNARLADLDALGQRLDELARRAASPDGLEELRVRVEKLAADSTHTPGLDALRADIAELAQRIDASAAAVPSPELVDRLDAVAGQAEAAQTGLAELASRLDGLSGLQDRIDGIAERLPGEGVVDEMRQTLSEVVSRAAGPTSANPDALEASTGTLVARLDQLAAQVEEIAAGTRHAGDDELRAAVDGLRARLDELHARPASDAVLAERLHALEQKAPEVTVHDVAAVAQTLEEQRSRFEARLGELAAAASDTSQLDGMRVRLEELAGAVAATAEAADLDERIASVERRLADLAPVGELRAEVQRVAESAAGERASLEQALLARVDEITTSVPAADDFTALRGRVDELAARPVADETLRAQISELTERLDAAASVGDSVESLRQTFASLDAARANDARATGERLVALEQAMASIDGLAAKLDGAATVSESVESLRQTFANLDVARANDARATGERLAGLEQAVTAFGGLEESIRHTVAESDGALAARIDEAQRRLDELGPLEDRLAGLRDDLASRVPASTLAETESALRLELAALAERLDEQSRKLAERPDVLDQTSRIDGIGVRLDKHTRDVHGRIAGLAADIKAQVEDLEQRTGDHVGREELGAAIAEQAARLDTELEELRSAAREQERDIGERVASLAERSSVDAVGERMAAFEGSLADGFRRLEALRHETAARLEESVGALREDMDGRDSRVHERISAQRALQDEQIARQEEIATQLEELRELAAFRDGWQAAVEARLDEQLDRRLAEIAQHLAGEAARVQTESERSAEALRAELAGSSDAMRSELDATREALRLELENSRNSVGVEVGSLAMRVDELHGLHHADANAARMAVEALGARIDEFHGLRAQDAATAQAAAAEAGARLEKLAVSLRREATFARETADRVAARVEELEGIRNDDIESARIAAAELVARLDDFAVRTAGAAMETEHALRAELSGVAARLEEQDAAGIEAREDLRAEVERLASSVGWRLERIEESLASDDSEALQAAVTEIERRLDAQLSQQDEQVRVTERALRKGLASLGERLADSETAYLEAGTTLRRSIERLGAAVVEADARMAEQIPVSEIEGYVAFAPTPEGYRLVQMPGRPPELGAAVEVDGCEGPLVVTRYGRSPLPLDNRPCAYLDRS